MVVASRAAHGTKSYPGNVFFRVIEGNSSSCAVEETVTKLLHGIARARVIKFRGRGRSLHCFDRGVS